LSTKYKVNGFWSILVLTFDINVINVIVDQLYL